MDKIIGLIYRFGDNDYQLNIMNFSQADQKILQDIFMKYDNDCSCVRGDKFTTIDDANIDYFEKYDFKDKE